MSSDTHMAGPARLSSAEQTRRALVRAALRLFGEKGFDGTSTREIAAAANANIGSIAYHFGGKEGLRGACAEYIVSTMGQIAGSLLEDEALAEDGKPDARQAQALLLQVVERMAGFVLARPEAGEIVGFLLRELQHPTSALDTIYEGVFLPVHRRLCRVWEAATGEDAESERTRITVFTLLGQVVYFRIGSEAVKRRMGWREIGPQEAEIVAKAVKDNLAAMLARRRER